MGARHGSLTTSVYFDMKMGVIRLEIRVESGNYKTIQIFGNMEIQKNPKKMGFFNNFTRNLMSHPKNFQILECEI
jgi:hypothetical protein